MSVRHALLALLSEGPKYGLRLQQEFHANTGDIWPLNVGQVYTTLQRLERDELVDAEGHDDGPQKSYRLTPVGDRELLNWLESSTESMPPPRDELVIKILIARTVPGVDMRELLQLHRRQTVELMQQYTRLKRDADDTDVELMVIVDAELFRLEGVIRWIDSVEARLTKSPKRTSARADTSTDAYEENEVVR